MVKSVSVALTAVFATTLAAHADPFLFAYTGGLQTFVAPNSGTYDILAFGASGGVGEFDFDGSPNGANGAEIGGQFHLIAGQTLTILVGGQGQPPANATTGSTGGGGGTFVVGAGNTPFVVAGGGGGGADSSPGQSGTAGTDGYTPPNSTLVGGAGGTNGGGGGAATALGYLVAGGGGGFFTDGLAPDAGGSSFLNGGAGGIGDFDPLGQGAPGGFGGGGGAIFGFNGGGGGYSGGGGSGGGGGSYLDLSATNAIRITGENAGNGEVLITSESPVPEPANFLLLGSGLLGVLAVLRRHAA